MTVMLEWLIKASLLLGLALAVTALLARRSAALRHAVLATAIIAALALPALALLSPGWRLPDAAAVRYTALSPRTLMPASRPTNLALPSSGSVSVESSVSLNAFLQGLGWIWLGGAVLLLALLVRGVVTLAALERRAVTSDPEWWTLLAELRTSFPTVPPVRLLTSATYPLPVTWGLRVPRVLVPASASEWAVDRRRAVLLHELAHIARHDWILHVAAETLRALLWVNPLVLLACRRLRHESEIACDDRVMAAGVAASDYATHLLELARGAHGRGPAPLPAPAIAETATLERRIRAMLKQGLNRQPVGRPARLTLIAIASAMTIFVAGGTAAQSFATFAGSVVDPTNAVLPQVTFQLTNSATGAKYEVQSDRNGRVELPGLPAGDYAIEARLLGFANFRSRIHLDDGQRFEPSVTMQVGELEETITATDPGAGIDEAPRILTAPSRANPVCPAASPTAPQIGGNIRPPLKTRHVAPVYPANFRGSGRSGIVELRGRIAPDGHIEEITTIASADPDFEAAAIQAVNEWQFSSTLLNCTPWPVDMRVHVRFSAAQ